MISTIKKLEAKKTIEKSKQADSVADSSSSRATTTNSISANEDSISSLSDSYVIASSDDGSRSIDGGVPIINSVGANYKTGDNRCGVAQRSIYLTVEASAQAEVYHEIYAISNSDDIKFIFQGDILGAISSIGLGGYVQAEGFVRNKDTNSEKSTLLMDANVGLAEIPGLTGNGDVDDQYGPGHGTVTDQPYCDYELITDIDAGLLEVGVRMRSVFNGLKGGVTQVNFMPQRSWFQPPNLGTEFSSIETDLYGWL